MSAQMAIDETAKQIRNLAMRVDLVRACLHACGYLPCFDGGEGNREAGDAMIIVEDCERRLNEVLDSMETIAGDLDSLGRQQQEAEAGSSLAQA